MQVCKRSGKYEAVMFDKITKRIAALCVDLPHVDPTIITKRVVSSIMDKMKTADIDEWASRCAVALYSEHPEYETLAVRITVSNLHKSTKPSFSEFIRAHMQGEYTIPGRQVIISDKFASLVMQHEQQINAMIDHTRDYNFSYVGLRILMKSYLTLSPRHNQLPVERPQYMYMRAAIEICMDMASKNTDSFLRRVKEIYDDLSHKIYTHATPTLQNAGLKRNQLGSCFILTVSDDSIQGIYDTITTTATLSQNCGGVGINVTPIRARGAFIAGSGGISNGIIPFLRVLNATAVAVDQGGGRRKGGIVVSLEPWHLDIREFLELRLQNGQEEFRTRDLFTSLWMNDLFMRRMLDKKPWTLFCPSDTPDLIHLHGSAFEKRYEEYEQMALSGSWIRNNLASGTQIEATVLWDKILAIQIQSGGPYLMYKDACNFKSNQQHLGTIKSTNLCTEILEYTDSETIAVCNLASLCLPAFVRDNAFQFEYMGSVVKKMVQNLNDIVRQSYYTHPNAERSNKKYRPIGLGVQGLADVFMKLDLPFDSAEAMQLNHDIFETIYFYALEASCELAQDSEISYFHTFEESPMGKFGKLHMDLWDEEPVKYSVLTQDPCENICRKRSDKIPALDWTGLREAIKKHGIANSLLVAPMPTASTSFIAGWNPSFEPITSNLFSVRVLAGDYIMVNQELVKRLEKMNLWNKRVRDELIEQRGSVQNLSVLRSPEFNHLKKVFRTVWEIPQKNLITMAASRGRYIDQSQSFNLFYEHPTSDVLSKCHVYSWLLKNKTAMYYLRTKPAVNPIAYSIDLPESPNPPVVSETKETECTSCSA